MNAPQPTTVTFAPAAENPYYRLIYDGPAKLVKSLIYSKAVTYQPAGCTIYACDTYAECQAQCTALELTGLPAQPAGAP